MHTPLHARTHTVQYNSTHEHLFELAVDLGLGHAVDEELDVGVTSAVAAELLHPRRSETRPVAFVDFLSRPRNVLNFSS